MKSGIKQENSEYDELITISPIVIDQGTDI
jgi:hypothetical protein